MTDNHMHIKAQEVGGIFWATSYWELREYVFIPLSCFPDFTAESIKMKRVWMQIFNIAMFLIWNAAQNYLVCRRWLDYGDITLFGRFIYCWVLQLNLLLGSGACWEVIQIRHELEGCILVSNFSLLIQFPGCDKLRIFSSARHNSPPVFALILAENGLKLWAKINFSSFKL